MKTKPILSISATFEDIIFENRNKAYGAFFLQKKFNKYLLIAFLISLTGVSATLAVPFLKALRNPVSGFLPGYTIRAELEKIDPLPEPPAPPPPPVPIKAMKAATYAPPEIVEEAPEELEMEIMGNLLDKTINPPIVEEIPIATVTPGIIDEPTEEPYINPQEHASFRNGDLNEFRKWIQTKIVYPDEAIEMGIFGLVIVEFCVNVQGQIADIRIVRGADPVLDEETIRVISSSPHWKAARQGGKPVKQQFVIPVTFRLDK
jgi:protein TonB